MADIPCGPLSLHRVPILSVINGAEASHESAGKIPEGFPSTEGAAPGRGQDKGHQTGSLPWVENPRLAPLERGFSISNRTQVMKLPTTHNYDAAGMGGCHPEVVAVPAVTMHTAGWMLQHG